MQGAQCASVSVVAAVGLGGMRLRAYPHRVVGALWEMMCHRTSGLPGNAGAQHISYTAAAFPCCPLRLRWCAETWRALFEGLAA